MIYAGTGHRPPICGGYADDAYWHLVEFLAAKMPTDASTIISGMALGFDMALAEAAVQKGVPFIAVVPFEGQSSRWTVEWRLRYKNLLHVAKEVCVPLSGGYHRKKMLERNVWMVDRADKVLALYSGLENSGTGHCVRYAMRAGKEVVNLWTEFNAWKTKTASEMIT